MPATIRCLVATLVLACAPAIAQTPAKPLTMQQVLDASRPSDWRRPDPANASPMT